MFTESNELAENILLKRKQIAKIDKGFWNRKPFAIMVSMSIRVLT